MQTLRYHPFDLKEHACTYVKKAKLRADVEDPAGGRRSPEEGQKRLGQQLGPVEVGVEDRLRVLHRAGVDLVERHRGIVHLHR